MSEESAHARVVVERALSFYRQAALGVRAAENHVVRALEDLYGIGPGVRILRHGQAYYVRSTCFVLVEGQPALGIGISRFRQGSVVEATVWNPNAGFSLWKPVERQRKAP